MNRRIGFAMLNNVTTTAICRHPAGYHSRNETAGLGTWKSEPKTPDAEKYKVKEAEQVGKHLVLKVLYPNCSSCAYEGNKVLVFLNTTALQAMRWEKIDPHFRAPMVGGKGTEAPSPAARFPANAEGWQDALNYARSKT